MTNYSAYLSIISLKKRLLINPNGAIFMKSALKKRFVLHYDETRSDGMGYITELRKLIGNRPIISVGSTVLVVNDDKKILFQHRSDTLDWGLPGGSMEINETLEQVAARELYEETGLVAKELEFIGVFSGPDYYYCYPNGDEIYTVIHLYRAKHVRGVLEMKDGESLSLTYFSKEELPNNMEQRTVALLNNLEGKIWGFESSFTKLSK